VISDQGSIVVPEIWNPDTELWSELAPHEWPRNYHSTALLLKDGRVISMGGGLCGDNCPSNHQNGEIFEPPYLFNTDGTLATRPTLNGVPATTVPGATLSVTGSADIESFSLVRLVALTHHHTTDQRRIPLSFTQTGAQSYQLELTDNPNVLIPGLYWLFAMNADGVPSEGQTVSVGVVAQDVTNISDIGLAAARLQYEYYELPANPALVSLPNFNTMQPTATGLATNLSVTHSPVEDYFGLRFTGEFEVETAGSYTFYLTSDDGSRLSINGNVVVDHDGLHGTVEKAGTIMLSAGRHELLVDFFEKQEGQGLKLEISGPGINQQDIYGFLMPLSESLDGGASGVNYEYYEGNWNQLPNFNQLTPEKTGVLPAISLVPRERDDQYAFRYQTSILATTPGSYTFFSSSDDGSKIEVNGQTVVSNDGLHPLIEKQGSINLSAGSHTITVSFFEKGGGEGLDVELMGPGMPRQTLEEYQARLTLALSARLLMSIMKVAGMPCRTSMR